MVITRCAVVNCPNTSKNSDCKFYRFPTVWWKKEQRNKWITAIRRTNPDGSTWHPKPHDRICSAHFVGGRKAEEQASPSYVPRIFPPVYKSRQIDEHVAILRFQLYMDRRNKEIEAVYPNSTNLEKVVIVQEETVVKKEPCKENDSCATKGLAGVYATNKMKEKLELHEEFLVKEESMEGDDLFATKDQASLHTDCKMKNEWVLQEEPLRKVEPTEEYVWSANLVDDYTKHVVKKEPGLYEELLVKEPREEDESITDDLATLFTDQKVKEELELVRLRRPGAPLGSVDGTNLNSCGYQLATTSADGPTSRQRTLSYRKYSKEKIHLQNM
ncbi:uncharacterized protein LOC133531553 isoform X2 [Cydia pomonella]|uniref:uncharacterized protein LOC133531553 isoform X2 n=1 Tax=Cydia pomonella TaxID=82600 RepID=UPI002ADE1214|nr:uncharacterized protein LOC133531553 isoform X2 [Cydia pomonella]